MRQLTGIGHQIAMRKNDGFGFSGRAAGGKDVRRLVAVDGNSIGILIGPVDRLLKIACCRAIAGVPETDPAESHPGVAQTLDSRKALAQRGEQHEVGPLLVVT